MRNGFKTFLVAASALCAAQPASAITWTDWTSGGGSTAAGTVGGVSVGYSGEIYFVQTGAPGEGFYNINSGNAPTTTDLIGNIFGGTKTITFSQSVTDVYMAVVSWNGQQATFDKPIASVESVCGYWGCGGAITNNQTVYGISELHGIIKFSGPMTSLTWTDVTEGWHGFTIGIGSVTPVTPPAVPETSTWAMMIAGFGAVGFALRSRTGRRRREVAVRFA